jgi:hypothetical protein
MAPWRPNPLLSALMIWSAVTFLIFWLPAVRGLLDGASYEWAGLFGFRGAGVAGDYWFPVFASALAVTFLVLGWRGARPPFALLLLGWHGFLALGATRIALTRPDDFRFQGDTLGVDFSLVWLGPLLFGGFFLLALIWVARQRRRTEPVNVPGWNARNWLLAGIAVGLLPVQFGLLRSGLPHGTTDQLGVLLTIVQWALINAAVYPWHGYTASVPERVYARAADVRV